MKRGAGRFIGLLSQIFNSFISNKFEVFVSNNEYKRVETYISTRNRVNESIERKSTTPNIGVSVDSFLKNLAGAGATTTPKVNSASSAKYKIGMEVKHKKFGVGIIENIEPEGDDFKLEIMFDGTGFKRLMANYTPLEIIKGNE